MTLARKNYLFLLILALPYLNDLIFALLQNSYYAFITVDYVYRIGVLAGLYFLYKKNYFKKKEFNLSWLPYNSVLTIITFTVLLFICHYIFQAIIVSSFSKDLLNLSLFRFPTYPNSIARGLDLTFGLALTAISEEVLVRGALISKLKQYKWSDFTVGTISMLYFALFHYGGGVLNISLAFVWAIAPTIIAIKLKKINELIVIH